MRLATLPSRLAAVLCLLAGFLTPGCTTIAPPSPPAKPAAALPRPVLVIGGIFDPFITATYPAAYIRRQTGETRIVAVHPGFMWSFEDAADLVVRALEHHFPSTNPLETIEVDVVGVSMGGLVARHAAAPGSGARKRLNIRRLYTLSAPHSGAQLADALGFFGTPLAMRSGSDFYRRLAQREQRSSDDDYQIVAYSRGTDLTIGKAGLALPPHLKGQSVYFPVPWYLPAHQLVYRDQRILGDIVRRLREPDARSVTAKQDKSRSAKAAAPGP